MRLIAIMKHLKINRYILLIISVLLATSHLNANQDSKCTFESTMSRVNSAIDKIVCLGLFSGPVSSADMPPKYNCGLALLGGSVVANVAVKKLSGIDPKNDPLRERLLRLADQSAASRAYERSVQSASFSYGIDGWRARQELPYVSERRRLADLRYSNLATKAKFYKSTLPRFFLKAGALGLFSAVAGILEATPAGCGDIDHMYIDVNSDCSYQPIIGPNTSRYLGLSTEEQKKIMSDSSNLCLNYATLAEKLEKDIALHFPAPEFVITSCDANNEVSGVDLKYPTERFSVNKSGPNSLVVNTSATHRVNFELFLEPNNVHGIDSLTSVRSKMKTSKLTRVYVPSEVMTKDPELNKLAVSYVSTSIRALHGFTVVKNAIKNKCSDYLNQASEESGVDQPTAVPK